MRVAITGITGFLGKSVAYRLIEQGYSVRGLCRTKPVADGFKDLPIEWFVGDITDPDSLLAFCEDVDWVIHSAGKMGDASTTESGYTAVNVEGARNIFAAAQQAKNPPSIIHFSAGGVIPATIDPNNLINVNEDAPYGPMTLYDHSKVASEKLAKEFMKEGLDIIIVRPEFIYGPGDTHVLGMFSAIQKGFFFYINGGEAMCHPTYIDDFVDGVLLAMECGKSGETYHVAGGTFNPFRELGDTIADALGVRRPWINIPKPLALAGASVLEALNKMAGTPVPLSKNGVGFFTTNRISGLDKSRRELGYDPKVSLKEGVERTIAWYKENGYL